MEQIDSATVKEMAWMLKILWINIPSNVLQQYGLSEDELVSLLAKIERKA